MKYTVFFALIAAVSATNTIEIKEDGKAAAEVISKKKGETITFECIMKTTEWSLNGIDGVDLEKRQDTEDYMKVNDKKSVREPFKDSSRFSVAQYDITGPVDGVYSGNVKVTVSALTVEDTGIYRCVLVRNENNVETVRLNSSEVTFNVPNAPSLSLTSDLMSPDPNKTITETVNNKLQFNWEISEQVSITCRATGSNPKPVLTVRRNGKEVLDIFRRHNGHLYTGDVEGLKTPVNNAMVGVSSYVPKSGDDSIECEAQVPGLDPLIESAKVVLSGSQMDVYCPPKNIAKLNENDFKVMCTINTNEPLTKVTLSAKGFTNAECEQKGKGDYTRAFDGVFCRYQKDPSSSTRYNFYLKISNVDSGKFQKYDMTFTNEANHKVSTSATINKDPKSGEIGGVGAIVPAISLLLISMISALLM